MSWEVELTGKAEKQRKKLPEVIRHSLDFLLKSIETDGPMRHEFKNFGKLGANEYHCHLKNGRPTYVACWRRKNKKIELIEVYYVGTHEKAPY